MAKKYSVYIAFAVGLILYAYITGHDTDKNAVLKCTKELNENYATMEKIVSFLNDQKYKDCEDLYLSSTHNGKSAYLECNGSIIESIDTSVGKIELSIDNEIKDYLNNRWDASISKDKDSNVFWGFGLAGYTFEHYSLCYGKHISPEYKVVKEIRPGWFVVRYKD